MCQFARFLEVLSPLVKIEIVAVLLKFGVGETCSALQRAVLGRFENNYRLLSPPSTSGKVGTMQIDKNNKVGAGRLRWAPWKFLYKS